MKLAVAFLATIGATAAFAPAANTVARTSALNMVQQLDLKTGQSQLDTSVVDRFNALPYPDDKVLAEYVWVDAKGECRSKTRTLPVARTEAVDKLPRWNFDGSSTDQAPGDDSEVILRPCRIFKDPFRPRADGLDNILVMCDTYTPAGEAIPTNTRAIAAKAFEGKEDEEVWFGLEQEFTLFNLDQRTPLGWPKNGVPNRAQGPYYCSAGPENSFGRAVTDAMYRCCLYAGLEISGTNGEVMPGQQEYQIGPCVGIDAGDQLFMSRYILQRVCEEFQVYCTLHPKPIVEGDWNGAGMHTNVSTKSMREAGGLDIIKQAIYKLGAKHQEHIAIYGEGNELRLTGKFETASMDEFSFGVANRGASVRIGRDTEADGCGYFEDRRPSSNADPYLVTGKIMATIMEEVEVPEIAPLNRAEA
ncbi:glutamine synthetase (class 2) [Skeletonema marinoi]|uniref:Glutamine synthetase n=1 Tax=Skeletonema marinoi TaxID=267567 RepID=A0AAD9D6U6_9STRA|nr:glutamine synthetase (class 2) [Skeletonema marinoi]